MKKQILFIILMLMPLPLVFAENLVMSVDQSEY